MTVNVTGIAIGKYWPYSLASMINTALIICTASITGHGPRHGET
jgi:hypothetical protein